MRASAVLALSAACRVARAGTCAEALEGRTASKRTR